MQNKRWLYLVATVLLWLVALLLLVAAGEGVHALLSGHHVNGGVGSEIFAIVILVLLAAMAGRVGLGAEHRFRGTHEARRAARSRRRIDHHRQLHPLSGIFVAVLAVALVAGGPIWAAFGYRAYERSQHTQHGIDATAVVLQVQNAEHCHRGGCYWTAALPARLAPAVRGRSTTTIHFGNKLSDSVVGAPLPVRLNPSDLGYAEFPGRPLDTVANWIVPLALWAGLWLVILGSTALSERRKRRRP